MRAQGMRGLTSAFALAAAAFASAAACMPSAFDDAVKKAPARSVSRPGSYGATDFGRIVATLPPDMTKPAVAGRFLAAGSNGRGISVVELDAQGKATVRNVATGVLGQLESNPVTSAAATPNGPPEGRVVMGVRKFQDFTGRYFQMTLGADFPLNKGPEPVRTDLTNWGLGIAAGNISGDAGTDDYAVLGEEYVILVEDGVKQIANTTDCDVKVDTGLEEKYRDQRHLIVADVIAGHADEIIVGGPRGGGLGNVRILRKRDDGMFLQCVLSLAPPDGDYEGKKRFGYSMAAGDFNGDGVKDLLVGAPPDRAFIYFGGSLVESMTPLNVANVTLVPMDKTQSQEFGWSVAAVNIDGRGPDEALVGDPYARVGGKTAAGLVTLFGMTDTTPAVLAQLSDTHPEETALFGYTVNPMRFCPAGCIDSAQRLVVVGSAGEVYTYFQIAGLVPELRKF